MDKNNSTSETNDGPPLLDDDKNNLLSTIFKVVFSLYLIAQVAYFVLGQDDISSIKNGHFDDYPEITIGEAVEDYVRKPEWSSGIAVDGDIEGETIVDLEGRIRFMGNRHRMLMQFVLYDDGDFEVNALELNGDPQNQLVINLLIMDMYDDL